MRAAMEEDDAAPSTDRRFERGCATAFGFRTSAHIVYHYSHPRPKRSAARSLIEAAMSGGNEPLAADMMRMAVVAGIGEATWFTAKKEAGIGSRLDGMPGQSGQHWVWTRAARHGHREFEMAGTGPRSRRRRGAGKGGAVRP